MTSGTRLRRAIAAVSCMLMLALVGLSGCLAQVTGTVNVFVQGTPQEEFEEFHITFGGADLQRAGGGIGDGPATGVERGAGEREMSPAREGWLFLGADEPTIELSAGGEEPALLATDRVGEDPYAQLVLVIVDVYGIDGNGTRVEVDLVAGELLIPESSFAVSEGHATDITIEIDLERSIRFDEDTGRYRFTPVPGEVLVEGPVPDRA